MVAYWGVKWSRLIPWDMIPRLNWLTLEKSGRTLLTTAIDLLPGDWKYQQIYWFLAWLKKSPFLSHIQVWNRSLTILLTESVDRLLERPLSESVDGLSSQSVLEDFFDLLNAREMDTLTDSILPLKIHNNRVGIPDFFRVGSEAPWGGSRRANSESPDLHIICRSQLSHFHNDFVQVYNSPTQSESASRGGSYTDFSRVGQLSGGITFYVLKFDHLRLD